MLHRSPKVSIIMPSYNTGKYLDVAVSSALDQTLLDIEVIIINDGSIDETGSIADRYSVLDERVKVFHKPNEGYGKAVNVGLSAAAGDYVQIFEPDDIISKGMIESLYELSKISKADIVKSNGFYRLVEGGVNQEALFDQDKNGLYGNHEEVYGKLWLRHPSIWNAIYKRSFIEKNMLKMPETHGASFQDVQWLLCLFAAAKTIHLDGRSYYYYRIHKGQSVNNADGKLLSIIENWEWYSGWLEGKRFRTKKVLEFSLLVLVRQFETLLSKRLREKECKDVLREVAPKIIRSLSGQNVLTCEYANKADKSNYERLLLGRIN